MISHTACDINGKFEARVPVNWLKPVEPSANLERRNLTKGQQAMALAMIYPEPERGRGRKDTGKKVAETAPFSYRRLAEARFILRYAPDLADSVMDSSVSVKLAQRYQMRHRNLAKSMPALGLPGFCYS
jgi:hypothetical protein